MTKRLSRLEERRLQRTTQKTGDRAWEELLDRIQEGNVIPIIGNSISYDRFFGPLIAEFEAQNAEEGGLTEENGCNSPPIIMNTENWLAKGWAAELDYPFSDCYEMSRVAQYCLSLSGDEVSAKTSYLEYIKQMMLDLAADTGADEETVEDLEGSIKELKLVDLAHALNLPRPKEDGCLDSNEILANLPLKVYVTTSYHTFLERALEKANRSPRTQVCFWRGTGGILNIIKEHETDPDYEPDERHPLVLHLFGLEHYPGTMVLGEDNYLDFLVRMAQDNNLLSPIIPVYLREALDSTSVMLLGYRLQDWDFRVLYRYLNLRPNQLRGTSMVIQLTPDQQYRVANADEAKQYLDRYFSKPFKVQWGDTDSFLNKLWEEYNNRR
jgi:hypothetical protein